MFVLYSQKRLFQCEIILLERKSHYKWFSYWSNNLDRWSVDARCRVWNSHLRFILQTMSLTFFLSNINAFLQKISKECLSFPIVKDSNEYQQLFFKMSQRVLVMCRKNMVSSPHFPNESATNLGPCRCRRTSLESPSIPEFVDCSAAATVPVSDRAAAVAGRRPRNIEQLIEHVSIAYYPPLNLTPLQNKTGER